MGAWWLSGSDVLLRQGSLNLMRCYVMLGKTPGIKLQSIILKMFNHSEKSDLRKIMLMIMWIGFLCNGCTCFSSL